MSSWKLGGGMWGVIGVLKSPFPSPLARKMGGCGERGEADINHKEKVVHKGKPWSHYVKSSVWARDMKSKMI